MKCFKRPLRRKHWAVHKFSSGLRGSKVDKWALKIILILGAREQVVPTRMSKKFEKKSTRIVGTQVTSSHKLQVWVGVPVSGFWPWIWTWDALPWSLFPACSHRTKKTLVWLCARNLKIRLKVTQTFFLRSSRATKVSAMGTTLRTNKLRANGRRQLHRDRKKQDKWGQMWKRCSLFFQCSRNRAPGIRSSWTDCQSGILLGGFEAIERECAKKTPRIVESGDWFLHHDNAPAHTALSVTRYLASLGWAVVPHPPYSPDLSPCDFFLFPTMKKHWKERDLPPWRRWKQLRRRHSTTSSFSSCRDASHSGKKDWTNVLPPMGSILKGIKCFLFEM